MPNLFISVLKGPSATGKGTRVCQLIEYLKRKEVPKKITLSVEGHTFDAGLAFPEQGFFFIGTYVVSNKSSLTSWSSMDMVHSTVKTAEAGRICIAKVCQEALTTSKQPFACVVLEGEPMLLSDKFRPAFMAAEYNPAHLAISYFGYTDRSQHEERIMGRSGKPGGDSGWSRASGYFTDFTKAKEEATQLDTTQCHLSFHDYDETYWMWGAHLLNSLGIVSSDFISWSKENPMLRSIGGADPLRKTKKLW